MISRKIHIKSSLPINELENRIRKGINPHFEFLASTIIHGKLLNHKITGVINPPSYLSDPFLNRILGCISEVENKTIIDIKVKLGWVNWGVVILICFFPLLPILDYPKNQNLEFIFEDLLITACFVLFTLILFHLKLRWDTSRLTKWLEANI